MSGDELAFYNAWCAPLWVQFQNNSYVHGMYSEIGTKTCQKYIAMKKKL